MPRKLIITILITVFPLIATAQLKVGIMNPERVMDSLPETTEIQQELQQFIQQKEEEFTQQYSIWIEEVTEFEQRLEEENLSEQERQQEEARLREREEELEGLERRLQSQIQNRQSQLIGPVMQRVENAMESVAVELDLDYVLNRQTSRGDLVVYYASERGIDITDQVIEQLTSN